MEKTFQLRVSQEAFEEWAAEARSMGLSVAGLIRMRMSQERTESIPRSREKQSDVQTPKPTQKPAERKQEAPTRKPPGVCSEHWAKLGKADDKCYKCHLAS